MSPDFGANIAEIVSPSFLPSASESRANDERSRRENKIYRNLGCENDSIDDSKHAIEGVETKNQKEIIERLKRESNGAEIARNCPLRSRSFVPTSVNRNFDRSLSRHAMTRVPFPSERGRRGID